MKLPDGTEGRCVHGESCRNLWTVISKDGQVLARFLVYVDDIVISGPRAWVEAVISMVTEIWKCKINGILVPAELESTEETIVRVPSLTFLGVTLEYVKGVLTMHQHAYILNKLDERNRLHGRGKA